MNFPAVALPLEAPAFPEVYPTPIDEAQPPVEEVPPPIDEARLPVDEAVSPEPRSKLKMALRPRTVEPIAPPPVPPPPPPISRAPPPAMLALAATQVLSGPPMAVRSPAAAAALAAAGKKTQHVALGIGVAGILIFAIAGYIAYQNLGVDAKTGSGEVAAGRRAPKLTRKPVEAVAPETAPSDPSAIPGSEIAKPEVNSADRPVPTGPSPGFQTWIATLRINGVRSGKNPRILVGGKSFGVGEIMNAELGITFDSYDPGRRIVRFREKSGWVLETDSR